MLGEVNDSGKPNIDPLAAKRIREKLGLPETVVSSLDSNGNEILHEEQLDDFQRLLKTTTENEFIRVASTIDLKSTDSQGMTIGHHAARLGYAKAYMDYRNNYPNPKKERHIEPSSFEDHRGNTPLDLAVLNDHLDVVKEILNAGKGWVKFNVFYWLKNEPPKIETLKTILKSPVSKDYESLFRKALNWAASTEGNNDFIDWLFDNWPNISRPDYSCSDREIPDDRKHPLNAAIQAKNNSAVEKLFARGLGNDNFGVKRPIEVAISSFNDEGLRTLIQRKMINTNVSPLYLAFTANNYQGFRILVEEAGCDINSIHVFSNVGGYLNKAIRDGNEFWVEFLIGLKANPHNPNESGTTPLGTLCSTLVNDYKRHNFIKMFAKAGVDISGPAYIDKKTGGELTVAKKLVDVDDIQGLVLLKELGVDLNKLDFRRENPLHTAVRSKKFHAFKKLIELGVDLNVKNKEGDTPLDLIKNISEYDAYRDYLRSLVG